MLSRRNIRIKVMQMLYSMSRDSKLGMEDAIRRYRTATQRSYELYLFCLLILTRASAYAHHVAAKKKTKLRPTDEDKRFTPKLAENQLVLALNKHKGFQAALRYYKLDARIDLDTARMCYTSFAKTEEYTSYLANPDHTLEEDRKILLAFIRHLANAEVCYEFIEENYPNWIDDESLVVGALKKTIKALPTEEDFHEAYRPPAETVTEFGEALLRTVCEEDEQLLGIIEPALRNWDADRVAVTDMVVLKMALAEFTGFPTIPTKVTLNEFVEIAKRYSTDKSKDFVNGILDRLMKQLDRKGKINKTGRGLKA